MKSADEHSQPDFNDEGSPEPSTDDEQVEDSTDPDSSEEESAESTDSTDAPEAAPIEKKKSAVLPLLFLVILIAGGYFGYGYFQKPQPGKSGKPFLPPLSSKVQTFEKKVPPPAEIPKPVEPRPNDMPDTGEEATVRPEPKVVVPPPEPKTVARISGAPQPLPESEEMFQDPEIEAMEVGEKTETMLFEEAGTSAEMEEEFASAPPRLQDRVSGNAPAFDEPVSSPKRSKEVTAYLEFIESSILKAVEWTKGGFNRAGKWLSDFLQ